MARDYVKGPDREFEAQVAQFLANIGPVKTALGPPAKWEAQLQCLHGQGCPCYFDAQLQTRKSRLPF